MRILDIDEVRVPSVGVTSRFEFFVGRLGPGGVSLDDRDAAIRRVVDGLSSQVQGSVDASDALQGATARILDNAEPRIAVLERFVGMR